MVILKRERRLSPVWRYGLAFGLAALALLLTIIFQPYITGSRFIFFASAVTVAAWFGGLGPGVLTGLLGILAVDLMFVEPIGELMFKPSDAIQFVFFIVLSLLISWTQEARFRSENAMRAAKAQLQAILNAVTDGIVAETPDDKLVFSNEAAAHIMGFESAQAIVNSTMDSISKKLSFRDEDGNPFDFEQRPAKHTARTGQRAEATLNMFSAEKGGDRWLTITSKPILDENHKVLMVISVIRDVTERLLTSLAVATERERLRVTLSSIADGVITTDLSGKIESANAVAEALTGRSREDMVGHTLESVFRIAHEDTNEIIEHPLDRVLRDGEVVNLSDHMLLLSPGRKLPIEYQAAPIRDEKKHVTGAIMVLRDVSERRFVEHLRHESEQRLRSLMDNLGIFVGLLTPDGVLVEANRNALNAANLQPEDVLGKHFEEAYWWSYSETLQTQLREAIQRAASGKLVRYDARVRVGEDSFITIDFTLAPMFNDQGEVIYLIPSGVDITERKRSEDDRTRLTLMLDSQRRRLQTIIENVPGIIWEITVKPDGTAERRDYFNSYAERLLGYSSDETSDPEAFWKRVILPEDFDAATKQLAVLAESETGSSIIPFRVLTREGRVLTLESRNTLQRDEDGKMIGAYGLVMDISERKRSEQALARYARDLRRSNEQLEQFAYVASHDLQEPLRMITSYLQLLEARYTEHLDDDAREFIGYAVDGASRMKSLINDLLMYSRVGRGEREFATVSMDAALADARRNLQMMIEENNAEITHDPLPEVYGDAVPLSQLLQNLISNAIKFRSEAPPAIHIGVTQHSDEWMFSVRDNGIGMEPQYLERIFIIFQRLHNKQKYSGTGIGLAISKKVVEHHGGRIWAESAPGQGTTFFFTLPRKREDHRER